MKIDTKEILSYEIFPSKRLGDIPLGIELNTLLEKFNIQKYIDTSEAKLIFHTKVQGGGALLELFNESIILYFVNNDKFLLASILVQNEFKGKYLNAISVGTPFIELYKLKKNEMTYDDDLFFPEGNYDFYVDLDYDECKEKLGYPYLSDYMVYGKDKEMCTCKIESFFFRKDI